MVVPGMVKTIGFEIRIGQRGADVSSQEKG